MVCRTMLGTALAYIAAAFFKVRISRAAAMQAGVPGFSVGAGAAACCAAAGWEARASPRTSPMPRPAAGKILKTLFIPLLLGIWCLPPRNNGNSLPPRQNHHGSHIREQPVPDDPRSATEMAGQTRGI